MLGNRTSAWRMVTNTLKPTAGDVAEDSQVAVMERQM